MPKQIFIFLDANFLLVPAQLKLDIYSEFNRLVPQPHTLVILEAILRELEVKAARLGPQSTFSREFRLSRQILEGHEHQVIHSESIPQLTENLTVDDFLLREVQNFIPPSLGDEFQGGPDSQFQVYIATNDKVLRRKARFMGIPVIFIRQKRYLDVEI
ncbi:MAG: type II toxin-antitoxin system VapC family toxin [Promethearchaeota archaeon]